MKVLALVLALCFAVPSAQAASRKNHRAYKTHSAKTRSHAKRANKAAKVKRVNRNRVN